MREPADETTDAADRSPSAVVAARVREHREALGQTQAMLAVRLRDQFGWNVDRTIVARIEARKRAVGVDDLFLLAAALDTSPSLLLTPSDESELMWPTPWRAVTANRTRAWIAGEVRMWEQDHERFADHVSMAWQRTTASEAELDRLAGILAAVHGVESVEDIDPDVTLAEKPQADSEVLRLRFEVAYRRHNWESHVGEWPWTNIGADLATLEANSVEAAAAARRLWGTDALTEIHRRRSEHAEDAVTSAEEAAASLRTIVTSALDVVAELASAVRKPPAVPPTAKRQPARGDGQTPA